VPRFPPDQVEAVTRAVATILSTLWPSMVVTTPSAGADLVVLGEAQRLGIPVTVVLPVAEGTFVEQSVADVGGDWLERYHAVVARAHEDERSQVVELGLDASLDWFLIANIELLDLGSRLASPGEKVAALVVRPADGEDPPSVTDDLAACALAGGLLVLTLDPRPGATTDEGAHVLCAAADGRRPR
jgi:hypothetical protein